MVVYFGPEVEKALKRYLEVREGITPLAGHEHALFYSAQRKRMGVQAVENMVKKYSRQITTTISFPPFRVTLIPLFLKSTSSISSPTHSETRIPVQRSNVTIARSRSFVFS